MLKGNAHSTKYYLRISFNSGAADSIKMEMDFLKSLFKDGVLLGELGNLLPWQVTAIVAKCHCISLDFFNKGNECAR